MLSPLDWLSDELEALADEGLMRHRRRIVPLPGGRMFVRTPEVRDFASNDLSATWLNDERVVAAAEFAAICERDVDCRAVPHFWS